MLDRTRRIAGEVVLIGGIAYEIESLRARAQTGAAELKVNLGVRVGEGVVVCTRDCAVQESADRR